MLNRMTAFDRRAFAGAGDLPSGPPLIGECDFRPADPSDTREFFGAVIVGRDDDDRYRVEVHLVGSAVPGEFPDDEDRAAWTFDTEPDAVAFAEFVCSGKLSLEAIDKIMSSGR